MARHPFESTLTDQQGHIIAGGTVTVNLTGTSTAATIYAASSGGSAITNSQITTGSDGSYKFWAESTDFGAGQRFRLVLDGGAGFVTRTIDDVNVFPDETFDTIDIIAESGFAIGQVSQYTTDNAGGQWVLRKARGTEASPTVIIADDNLGIISFRGYDSTGFTGSKGAIRCDADENWSATANGTRLTFHTTDNTTTTLDERVRIDHNGRVGIGTSNPSSLLDIVSESSALATVTQYSTDNVGGQWVLRKARGTEASPTVIVADDTIGTISFRGYDSSGMTGSKIAIIGVADENWSASATGTRIQFHTTDNTTTTLDERMRIDHNGNVGIGSTNPSAQLHVDQTSTTAAIPVLYLDQADISEEMIEFNTTIGTGNAIEAVGAKTLTTTHFIKVTLPGSLTRYIPCGTIA